MKIEYRQFRTRTNLLVVSESEEDSEILDQLGKLNQPLKADLRLSDGFDQYYLLIEGEERRKESD